MAIDLAAFTGTEAVVATEWSLVNDSSTIAASTTVGVYQLWLDVSDMVAGDTLRIRGYEKVRAGDTQRVFLELSLAGAQADGEWVSDSFALGIGWDFTLLGVAAGTTVLWAIRRVS